MERYYMTGAQLGVIKGILNPNGDLKYIVEEINKILKEIEENQFIGNITKEGEKIIIAG